MLVNNAGILRDRMMVNMTEAEWDAVIKVHLKGTFAPSHFAAAYWRDQSKAGNPVDARIINTSSSVGHLRQRRPEQLRRRQGRHRRLHRHHRQELGRYGVTVNAIAPTALTRMTEDLGLAQVAKTESGFDRFDPAHISPLVVYLGSESSKDITGRVFSVFGGTIAVNEGWVAGPKVEREARWEPGEIAEVLPDLVRQAAPNADTTGQRASS